MTWPVFIALLVLLLAAFLAGVALALIGSNKEEET